MLTLTSPIAEVTTHVFEPIAKQFVHKLIHELGYDQLFKENIYFTGDYMGASKSNDGNNNPIVNQDRFNAALSFNLNPRVLKWDAMTFKNIAGPMLNLRSVQARRPIFIDPDTSTILTEHEVPATMTISCSMRFVNRADAYDALVRMQNKYLYGEMIMVNDYSYDYRLSQNVITVLYAISKMKGIPPQRFMQFLTEGSNNHITFLGNRNAPDVAREVVVQRNAFNVYTQLDYNPEKPEVEMINASPSFYKIDFVGTLQFSRINMLLLQYPVVINNQFISDEIVCVDPSERNGRLIPQQLANIADDKYRQTLYPNIPTEGPVRFPWYDNWTVPSGSIHKQLSFVPFLIGAFTLDNTDDPNGTTTINLVEDLDEYALTEVVLKSFREDQMAALSTSAVFNIAVYIDNVQVEPSTLTFDGVNLTIQNRKINHVYRIVLSKQKEYVNGTLQTFRVAIYDLVTSRE